MMMMVVVAVASNVLGDEGGREDKRSKVEIRRRRRLQQLLGRQTVPMQSVHAVTGNAGQCVSSGRAANELQKRNGIDEGATEAPYAVSDAPNATATFPHPHPSHLSHHFPST